MNKINPTKPLIVNFANIVTANICANALLAIGASPVMALDKSDIKALTNMAQALVINLGTVKTTDKDTILAAIQEAKKNQIPIILDPVGSGASKLRTNLTLKIMQLGISVLKGNMSEIKSLIGHNETHGVDATSSQVDLKVVQNLSKKYNCIIAITGPKDLVVEQERYQYLEGGSSKMGLVTGLGCITASLIGAFCTTMDTNFEAVLKTLKLMKSLGKELFDTNLPSYNQICNWLTHHSLQT